MNTSERNGENPPEYTPDALDLTIMKELAYHIATEHRPPSYRGLAKLCHMPMSSVRMRILRLAKHGYVVVRPGARGVFPQHKHTPNP